MSQRVEKIGLIFTFFWVLSWKYNTNVPKVERYPFKNLKKEATYILRCAISVKLHSNKSQ